MTAAPPRWSLRCSDCGTRHAAFAATGGCPDCARRGAIGPLAVEGTLPGPGDPGALTLGEGGTPLLRAPRIAARLDLPGLAFKLEGANPTGSYKDRYVAATLNAVLPFGVDRIVVSSTGNLGVAAAAYAAAAGIPCLFLAAAGLPDAALVEAQAHGATVAMTDPERRQILFEHAVLARGWFPIALRLRRRVNNPFGIEGYRAIATELAAAPDGPPDAVLFPCARGNGLAGAWAGFAARPGTRPRMIACQPDSANSLEVALAQGGRESRHASARRHPLHRQHWSPRHALWRRPRAAHGAPPCRRRGGAGRDHLGHGRHRAASRGACAVLHRRRGLSRHVRAVRSHAR